MDTAPYATGPTSILVYRGKGILVQRAPDLPSAILDAMDEFELRNRCASPASVYISAYIGAQGQEVIVSRSAFVLVRDTIPLHVHIKEEDHMRTPSELARWPPPPLNAALHSDLFRPARQFTLRDPPRPDQAQARLGSDASLDRARNVTSSESASRIDSISDWRRNATGTPDTAPSVHSNRYEPSSLGARVRHPEQDDTPPLATIPEQQQSFVQSPEEMLPAQIPSLNLPNSTSTLPSGTMAAPEQGGLTPLTGNASMPSASGSAGKSWNNWFKKAIRGDTGSSHSPSRAASSGQPSQAAGSSSPALPSRSKADLQPPQDVSTAGSPALAPQISIGEPVSRPGPAQQQNTHTKRDSKQVAQEIKDILSDPRKRNAPLPEPVHASAPTQPERQTQKKPARDELKPVGPATSQPWSSELSEASESWGPGGLVLDDGGHSGSHLQHGATSSFSSSQRQPWWARPGAEGFDTAGRHRNKMGLRPLRLGKSTESSGNASLSEADMGLDSDSELEERRDAHARKSKRQRRPRAEVPTASLHKHTETLGSATPKGIVMTLSSPGSPDYPVQPMPPSRHTAQGATQSRHQHERAEPPDGRSAAQVPETRRDRGRSREDNDTRLKNLDLHAHRWQPSFGRPLPDDIPESPANNKRFTRQAEQLDSEHGTSRVAMPPAPAARRPKKRSDSDIVPIVPVAKSERRPRGAGQARPVASEPHRMEGSDDRDNQRHAAQSGRGQRPGDFPETPESSGDEGRPSSEKQRPAKKKSQTSGELRGAGTSSASTANVTRSRPVRTVVGSQSQAPAPDPVPVVPVATSHPVRPGPQPLKGSKTEAPAAAGGGSFAAALAATRRQMTKDRNSTLGEPGVGSACSRSAMQLQGDRRPSSPQERKPRLRQHLSKRSSLSSMRDFVPATLPARLGEQDEGQEELDEGKETVLSFESGQLQPPPTVARSGSVLSRDSYTAGNADTCYIDRVVLGPVDLSSPNRKGSQLVLRAQPSASQISVEWKQEKKAIVTLAFDAIAAIQLPGPDCETSGFIVLRVHKGEVREILLEMSQENLTHFNRFLLIVLAGAGAEIDHLSAPAFNAISEANGW